ncbi:hypothetical protein EJB05_13588, partial [Eragrostis curvula]
TISSRGHRGANGLDSRRRRPPTRAATDRGADGRDNCLLLLALTGCASEKQLNQGRGTVWCDGLPAVIFVS